MEVLDREQVEHFHRDGYLKFRQVIGREQLEALRTGLDRVIAEEQAGEGGERPPEFAYGHDRKGTTCRMERVITTHSLQIIRARTTCTWKTRHQWTGMSFRFAAIPPPAKLSGI